LVSSAEILPWDTEFWGVRIARADGDVMTAESAQELEAWAVANDIACLYFLAGEDATTAHAAEEAGFRLMDVRLKLTRKAVLTEQDERVRPFEDRDLPAICDIARTSHRATRFYADPHFEDDRCDDLYERWIVRSVEGWADAVFVADHGGRPAAYLSVHSGDECASIGLLAVAEQARGSGLGAALVDCAVAWAYERGLPEVAVVTQGRSSAALRVYERCGFTVEEVGLWFHRWFAL
jgi:dTDP-4-amino-4,6-dideoxy-D-galactose acyltransferase